MHLQVSPWLLGLHRRRTSCPESLPEIKAIAVYCARPLDTEALDMIGIYQGSIIIYVLALHTRRQQRIVVYIVRAFQHGSLLKFQTCAGLEKQSSGKISATRHDNSATPKSLHRVYDILYGLCLENGRVFLYAIIGNHMVCGSNAHRREQRDHRKNLFINIVHHCLVDCSFNSRFACGKDRHIFFVRPRILVHVNLIL